MPDIKVLGTFKDYHKLLNQRLKYLHKRLQNFKSTRIAMMNKDQAFFQYNSRDLIYVIFSINKSTMYSLKKGND